MRWISKILNPGASLYVSKQAEYIHENVYCIVEDDNGNKKKVRLLSLTNELGVVRDSMGTLYIEVDAPLLSLISIIDGFKKRKTVQLGNLIERTRFYKIYDNNVVVFRFFDLNRLDKFGIFYDVTYYENDLTRAVSVLDIYVKLFKSVPKLQDHAVYIEVYNRYYQVEMNRDVAALLGKVAILK